MKRIGGSWRLARPEDDDAVVALCLSLYTEDPGENEVTAAQTRATLAALRREPHRGRAVVLALDGAVEGYALLIAFWSNELGGEVCDVDELYVRPEHRGQGHGSELFGAIERAEVWPATPVAMALQTTPGNARARRLYERLGFRAAGTAMARARSR